MTTNVFAQNKLIASDVALYKVEDEVVFLSTYKQFRKDLEKFRCFNKEVLLLPAVGLDKDSLKVLPSGQEMTKFDDKLKIFIKKIILLKKALIHIKKQKRKYGKKYFQYFEKHKCLKSPYKNWPKNIQNLVIVEIYFQERFQKGTSFKPLKTYDAKTWENVRFYLLSLDKKIDHHVFF